PKHRHHGRKMRRANASWPPGRTCATRRATVRRAALSRTPPVSGRASRRTGSENTLPRWTTDTDRSRRHDAAEDTARGRVHVDAVRLHPGRGHGPVREPEDGHGHGHGRDRADGTLVHGTRHGRTPRLSP